MKHWLNSLGVVLILCCLNPVISSAQEVDWNVSTNREIYSVGQVVRLSLEACNTGAATQIVDINVAPSVIDNEGNQVFASTLVPWVNMIDIPVGECRSATDQYWDQRDMSTPPPEEQVPPGWYRGEFLSTGGLQYFSSPFQIQVAQPVPMSGLAQFILIVFLAASGWIVARATGLAKS